MATVFGIDPEAMAKIVSRSTDIDTGTFDIDNLHERCLKAKTVAVPTPQEPYDMAPAQFLCNLQQGKSVAMADKKLLEYLQTELKMDRQVINVMVEGIIKHCNGRLDKAYVEKVATSWIRQPLTNVDQAKEAVGNMTTTNTRRSSRQKRPDFAPDDYSQNTTDFGQLQDQLFKKE
jgi:replication initiation and membrane attachment protein